MLKHITNIDNIWLLCLMMCIELTYAQAPFINIANDLNLNHTYNGNNGGGGVSCIDFNQDGIDDISLATGSGEVMKFFQSTNTGDFVCLNLIPDNLYEIKQILWIDYDNDGDKDLFAAAFDGVNKLYRNNGQLNLEDVSVESGIAQDTTRTLGASFGDFNRDGWIDLYYSERSLLGDSSPNKNRLLKNNADGTFTDVSLNTNSSDINRLPFCSVFGDFNNDKWPDIYIANDRSTRNTLLINLSGFFIDASVQSGMGLEMEAMSTALGDFNKDGLLDAYVSNNILGNKLFVNNADSINLPYPYFNERAEQLNISVNSNCWGSIFFDYDNDKYLDLYVSTSLVGIDTTQSVLFRQSSDGVFLANQNPMIGDTVASFNNAIGDFNLDGFPDIVVQNKFPFNFHIWENQTENKNWIKINLKGIISNTDGIGSKIELYSQSDYQQIYTTSAIGFFGQNSDTYIFGVDKDEQIDSLKITWPTGHIDLFQNLNSNNLYQFYEGQSTFDSINIDTDISILPNHFTSDSTTIDTTNITFDKLDFSFVKCYPNPSNDILNIELDYPLELCDIKFYDSSGIMHTIKGLGNKLPIQTLNNGFFIIVIKNQNKIHFTKFIKEN